MSPVTGRLRSPLQGALAGGGDPASSPLYVFGPALRLLVTAGIAKVAFGATLWLVVLTFFVVSAMYRRVMIWVTDGSGGSGLSGEEFGDTAVKLSAAITFIEYTLTFLVSMAALVTFVADRLPTLNDTALLLPTRAWLAIALSIGIAWLVNRGPATTSRAFGPATAAVLVLLWVMIAATIVRNGVRLPSFRFAAFEPKIVGTTMGGYVRLLAAMTGVEVFANLVGAFDGTPAERSSKAFRGLLIVMVSTGATMLIVGPAVQQSADPLDPDVSVFTQTMDALLPDWLSRIGTIVGVAVLLSACAASAIGLQNLSVGLRLRHFIPAPMGRINRFGVADRPVWIEAGIASACFVVIGTQEDTYLALYAAGVFVLLAMTGWAAMKRLVREFRATAPETQTRRPGAAAMAGTGLAAALTSAATITIFIERFTDGVWTYFVMVPAIMMALTYFRRSLGPPTVIEEQVGAAMGGGTVSTATERLDQISTGLLPSRVIVALDDTDHARSAIAPARAISAAFGSELSGVTVGAPAAVPSPDHRLIDHGLNDKLGFEVEFLEPSASVATALCAIADRPGHLLVMSTHGRSGPRRTVMGSVTAGVIRGATNPILIVPPAVSSAVSSAPVVSVSSDEISDLSRILVPLDGSTDAELVLVHVSAIASLDSVIEVILAHIPSGGAELVPAMEAYLERIASSLEHTGTRRVAVVQGHAPSASIPSLARELDADLVMMTTHGRGGVGRHILGSVAEDIIRTCPVPVFVVPVANQVRVRTARVPSGRERQPLQD